MRSRGAGRRHARLRPGHRVDAKALMTLIETAYTDMKGRLYDSRSHEPGPRTEPQDHQRRHRRDLHGANFPREVIR